MFRICNLACLFLLMLVILISLVIGVTDSGRIAAKSALFITQVVPNWPVKPLEWISEEPTYEKIYFPSGANEIEGDLYIPNAVGPHPGVVIFFGVMPAGRDDPRVVNLAKAFARSNVAVLIPWSKIMTNSRLLDVDAKEMLVAAFEYLGTHQYVDSTQIGLGGFCVGASFAALAAADKRINDKVAYLNSFGGYYDARNLLVSIASNTRSYNGLTELWEPRDDSREVLFNHLIETLSNDLERSILLGALGNANSVSGDVLQNLSDQGLIIYRLISGVNREDAEALLGLLPDRFLVNLDNISPSTTIELIESPVLIMHDKEDKAVPSTESRYMFDNLKDNKDVYHTEFSLFNHVDITRTLPIPDMLRELVKLSKYMYRLMYLAT